MNISQISKDADVLYECIVAYKKHKEEIKKKRKIYPKYISVNVGDFVSVETHISEFKATVLYVEKRYGFHSNATIATTPLVILRSEDGTLGMYDNSYITKIIKRSKIKSKPVNIFKSPTIKNNKVIYPKYDMLPRKGKNCIVGYLYAITQECLMNIQNVPIEREINELKLNYLYIKSKTVGQISCEKDEFNHPTIRIIRLKPFKKWLRKNILKILKSTKEEIESQTNEMLCNEADYISEMF